MRWVVTPQIEPLEFHQPTYRHFARKQASKEATIIAKACKERAIMLPKA